MMKPPRRAVGPRWLASAAYGCRWPDFASGGAWETVYKTEEGNPLEAAKSGGRFSESTVIYFRFNS